MILSTPIITFAAATLLCGASLVLAFFRRVPAAVVSFLAMIIAGMSRLVVFSSSQYWFWGIAVAIACCIQYLSDAAKSGSTSRNYIVGGALAGSVIGLALGTQASVIVAAAIGGLLGFEAFRRTPSGKAMPRASRLNELASICLPAVVNFSILMLIFAQLIQ